MPTIFSFISPPKRRKCSEARQAKAQHTAVVEELSEMASVDVEPLQPVVTTRDIGVQCGNVYDSM